MSGPPAFESVTVETSNFQNEKYSIFISWIVQNAMNTEITLNATLQSACINNTSDCVLEGEYNVPLLINITAINCTGAAEELVTVFECKLN